MLCSRILCSSGEGKAKKKEILHDVTMSGNGGISRLASAGSEGQGGQMESFVANNLNATTRRRDNRQQETGGADKAALVAALVLAAVAAALVNNGCRQCWHWRRKNHGKGTRSGIGGVAAGGAGVAVGSFIGGGCSIEVREVDNFFWGA